MDRTFLRGTDGSSPATPFLICFLIAGSFATAHLFDVRDLAATGASWSIAPPNAAHPEAPFLAAALAGLGCALWETRLRNQLAAILGATAVITLVAAFA